MSKAVPREILSCPACGSAGLVFGPERVQCEGCGREYGVDGARVLFIEPCEYAAHDPLDRLKSRLKSHRRLYALLVRLVSPVFFTRSLKRFLGAYVDGQDVVAVNLGSGYEDISAQVTNIDVQPYESVDLTCEAEHLPFRDASVDVVMSIALLEHVREPSAVIAEAHRVLKPGGMIYTNFPFIQGFHASPYDFSRYTYEGIKVLHSGFECVRVEIFGGPTSAFLWVFQEWLAMLLSFGIRPLYRFLQLLLMLLTFPLKFLDVLLSRHPMSRNIASNFVYIGRNLEEGPVL